MQVKDTKFFRRMTVQKADLLTPYISSVIPYIIFITPCSMKAFPNSCIQYFFSTVCLDIMLDP